MNFFDTNAMTPKTVTITRYRGDPRAFMTAMFEETHP